MKFAAVLALALSAAPGFAGSPKGEVPAIALYTQFRQPPAEEVVQAVRDELEAIMTPIGLHFDWRALSDVKGNEVSVELAVLTFKGNCGVMGSMSQNSNPGALGWTHVSDGSILPFSDIDCDRIRGFIQKDLVTLFPAERAEAFGRAVARVVAHELYHIFANTGKHGRCGVGKATYSPQELMSENFVFEHGESVALRNGRAREVLGNPGPPL